ncbi:MAG TPA: hypothetical protein VGF12_07450 [Roseateles sp.]|uniref:hypothetical protein n=1 Tax=Roseateles sp. TaxID=1971397 RepID=UPI002ED881E0
MPQPEPQRQVEVPRVQTPQPQQAQPRAQPRDEGPQRGRQDGVPVRRDRPQNDARPNERQAER